MIFRFCADTKATVLEEVPSERGSFSQLPTFDRCTRTVCRLRRMNLPAPNIRRCSRATIFCEADQSIQIRPLYNVILVQFSPVRAVVSADQALLFGLATAIGLMMALVAGALAYFVLLAARAPCSTALFFACLRRTAKKTCKSWHNELGKTA